MSFANLKRQSGNLDKLKTAVEALSSKEEGSSKSENFWKPEVDKVGNGMAVIRFLPASEVDGDDSLPWVKSFTHGFQGPGGQWLIDECLTTKNEKCPICDYNSSLWATGIEANKDVVRKQKRKLSYIANVYIVSDSKHPENNGQVKLFKFGKKIFDKITGAMNPEFEDEEAINPFDLWKGANFKLKIRKVDGYQNYDSSSFESAGPLLDDDAELEKIWKKEFSLKEQIADSKFKSYDELQSRLDKVLGLNGETIAPKTTVEILKEQAKKTPKFDKEDLPFEPDPVAEDDDLTYFAKLAEED
jgi:hypothetical protein